MKSDKSGKPGRAGRAGVTGYRPRLALDTSYRPALLVLAGLLAVLSGCSSASHGQPSGTSSGKVHHFSSEHYGYSVTLPATWTGNQASAKWNGAGSPGFEDNVVDTFSIPHGVAWAYSAPSGDSLPAYVKKVTQLSESVHGCPAPGTDQAITIGGSPARLLGGRCGGAYVLLAITTRGHSGFTFAFQDPSAQTSADRATFRQFLAGIRFTQ